MNIIGEVAREGSELSALGNTWLKRNQKILEKNSAKDVLVLVLPTMATPALTILYENQVCTLETLEDSVSLPAPKVCFTLLTTPPPLTHHAFRLAPKLPTAFVQPVLKGQQSSLLFRINFGYAFRTLITWSRRSPGRLDSR